MTRKPALMDRAPAVRAERAATAWSRARLCGAGRRAIVDRVRTGGMMQAFFSYSHIDHEAHGALIEEMTAQVETLTRAAHGSRAFSIWRDDALRWGEDWERRIDDVLAACDLFIVLLTPGWLKSDQCVREYEVFRARFDGEAIDRRVLVVEFSEVVLDDRSLSGERRALASRLMRFTHKKWARLPGLSKEKRAKLYRRAAEEVAGFLREVGEGDAGDQSASEGEAPTLADRSRGTGASIFVDIMSVPQQKQLCALVIDTAQRAFPDIDIRIDWSRILSRRGHAIVVAGPKLTELRNLLRRWQNIWSDEAQRVHIIFVGDGPASRILQFVADDVGRAVPTVTVLPPFNDAAPQRNPEVGVAIADVLGTIVAEARFWDRSRPDVGGDQSVVADVTQQTPQGRKVDVTRQTGRIATRPPDAAPQTGALSNDALLKNIVRQARAALGAIAGEDGHVRSNSLAALAPTARLLGELVASSDAEPIFIHDDFDHAVRDIRLLSAGGEIPAVEQSRELSRLVRTLRNGIADLRRVYPELAELHHHRQVAHIRPLTEDENEALRAALDAIQEVVDDALGAELNAEFAAVQTDRPTQDPDLELEEGPLKDRLYKLGGLFVRIYRISNMPPHALMEKFDESVDAASRLEAYARTAERLRPLFNDLRRWLQTMIV